MLKLLVKGISNSSKVLRLEKFIVPQPGEGIAEITIRKWEVKPNDQVSEFQKICEVFSDKSSIDFKSPYDGSIISLLHKENDVVQVGQALYTIDIDDAKYPESSKSSYKTPTKPEISEPAEVPFDNETSKIRLSPSARRLANMLKIDLAKIPATGKGGMLIKDDFINYISTSKLGEPKTPQEDPHHIDPPVGQISFQGQKDRVEKLSPTRSEMHKIMTEALKIPHLTYSEDICIDQLAKLKNQLKLNIDVRLTYMPFLIKALSMAILDFPIINSTLLDNLTEYLQKGKHNISIAMDTPDGLKFPNIKNVSQKSVYEIALDLNRLRQLGSIGKLTYDDLQGGTICISNLGSIGGTYASHIIFPPQVFIGAFGVIRPRLEKNGDKIIEKQVMNTSWGADHRLIDGATTARFVARWKALIENPSIMLLDLK